MYRQNKIWIVLGIVLVGAVTLACSCGALSSLLATPTPVAPPTRASEPMPGLEATWRDTQEGTNHTIVWDGTTYHVVSSVNDTRGENQITSEYWDGSTFTFDYYVPSTDVTVTIECTGVSGDSLYVNWTSSNGNSGTDVFTRQ